ncbi:MAG: 2-phospho-L-lactate guanylyltransferase [Chloroflexota bacterium]
MSLWAIIPVKPLNRAKSRLSSVLTPEQRAQLAEMMFRRMLMTLSGVSQIAGTLVISRDAKALSIARELGAKTIQEHNPSDLNPALTVATRVLQMWHATATLILPADLPFITQEDVVSIAELGKYGKTVILATDKEQDGTNAMLVRPAGLIPYAYGKQSFKQHAILARSAGAEVKFYESNTIALDVDVPEDLEEFNRRLTVADYEMLSTFLPNLTTESPHTLL